MKVKLENLAQEQVSAQVTRQLLRGERLEFILYTYQPGATFNVHSHEAEQLTIVLSGTLVFTFAESEVRLEAGEAVLIPSHRPHGAYVPAGAETTRTYNLFSPTRSRLPGA